MDVVSHFELKRPLFSRERGEDLFSNSAFEDARAQLIDAVISGESPVVLTGQAGVGKTALLDDVARQLDVSGIRAAPFSSPARVADASFALIDVAIIDECDTASVDTLSAIAALAAKHRKVVIFAALDAARTNAVREVRLAPMPGRQTNDFLLDAAVKAGRPDLFSPAAQDAIVGAAHGVPRILKMIANGAVMEAMFEGGNFVEARHADAAIAAKAPLPPPAPDYTIEPSVGPPPVLQRMARILDVADPIEFAPEPVPESRHEGEILFSSPLEPEALHEDEVMLPPPPEPAEQRRRFGRLGTYGAVVGVGALVLLVAAVIAYGFNTFLIDRLTAFLRPPSEAPVVTAPTTAAPLPPTEAAVLPADALVDPAAEASPTDTAVDPVGAAPLPTDADEDKVAFDDEPLPPLLPTADTPGYRPPATTLPTISAAVRAGIANPVNEAPQRAAALPQQPLSLGVTKPLSEGSVSQPLPRDGSE